jgi:uncharacterized membrane protein HdeD (DUF308 family)
LNDFLGWRHYEDQLVSSEEREAYNRGILHGCGIGASVVALLVLCVAPEVFLRLLITLVALVVLFGGLGWLGVWLDKKYYANREQFERRWKVVSYIVVVLLAALFVWTFFNGKRAPYLVGILISVGAVSLTRYIFARRSKGLHDGPQPQNADSDTALEPPTRIECPICGGPMGLRLVSGGERAWVCRNSPVCTGTRPWA